MSSGLSVDMAFWTFKTVISVFPCVVLQYKKKMLSYSILTFCVQSTYLLFKGSKNSVLFLFRIDFLPIVSPWIISFVPGLSSSLIMWRFLLPWELRLWWHSGQKSSWLIAGPSPASELRVSPLSLWPSHSGFSRKSKLVENEDYKK